ncbi:hypothetical protein [Sphingobium lignivorans]|uniref:Uncharacterized protein n=1 Tax=Sphingobium lignivorans TaxID=2735886 RepID=A0ABR6NKH4_9SPHN|nr:hypothetical protein [Sphingobium lignivorans]MBB5986993.1 hypothetical protein [Sphingobium lignivorans]
MSNETESELDRQVSAKSKEFAEHVRGLASNPSLRDALLRACVSDLVWELYFEFPDSRYALQEELEEMAGAVKASIAEDRLKERQAS